MGAIESEGHRHPEHSEGSPIGRIEPIRGDPSTVLGMTGLRKTPKNHRSANFPIDCLHVTFLLA
jgi:hypothetical protein